MSALETEGAAAARPPASLPSLRRSYSALTVYNPYKIFQAARRCMGDPSIVAEVLVELLGDCATPDVLMASASSVIKLYYVAGGLRKSSMTDFGKFAGELAEEFGKRESAEAEEKMKEAQSVYELFQEADIDQNGSISRDEFVTFGTNIDVPEEEEALALFERVDKDKNGAISFSEWLQFCIPGAGRDNHSFNCACRHGLVSSKAGTDEVFCNWCGAYLEKGSKMFACIECDCEACLDCTVLHLTSCVTRISCDRPEDGSACLLCTQPRDKEG